MHLSDDVPPIDPHTLKDLETHAKRVADNLQQMMVVLRTNLHKVRVVFSGFDRWDLGIGRKCTWIGRSA